MHSRRRRAIASNPPTASEPRTCKQDCTPSVLRLMGQALPPVAGREAAAVSDASLLPTPARPPLIATASVPTALPGPLTAGIAGEVPKWKGQAPPVPGREATAPMVKKLLRLPAMPGWVGAAGAAAPERRSTHHCSNEAEVRRWNHKKIILLSHEALVLLVCAAFLPMSCG